MTESESKQPKQRKKYGYCKGWDFRCNVEYYPDYKTLIDTLNNIAKEWVFQLEKGSQTGYEHYQGRFRLKGDKKTKSGVGRLIKWNFLEPSNNTVFKNEDFDYVLKDETRIKGPWKSTDYINQIERKGLPPIWSDKWFGDPVIKYDDLYPFQKSIVNSESKNRTIDVLVCPKGNIGKSSVMDYIIYHGLGVRIPGTVNNSNDIMQILYCKLKKYKITDPGIIIVDLPRAINQDKLAGIWAGLEEIRNGWVYDLRYSYKEKKFKSPRIWVFMNKTPDMRMLSKDRWALWTVNDEKELIKLEVNNGVPLTFEEWDIQEELD